jgi:predicted RNase H-like nuclease (RuvC/YqgF family)
MILERLSKIEKNIEKLKENEQLIENIVRNPETIVGLLRERYSGMDFKITCKKSDSRKYKNKKITDGVVKDT